MKEEMRIVSEKKEHLSEEIKHLKHEYQECLKLPNWMQSGMAILGKMSTLLLLKKAIKK